MAKRILITGGSGFVGANLARYFSARGHEIHLLLRSGYREWRLAGAGMTRHEGDLSDQRGLRSLLGRIKPDWIFHLAAYGAYSRQNDLDTIIRTNFAGTAALVEASRAVGFERFVNAGSSSEYGHKDHPPHEREWLDPNSHYAVAKAAATHLCRHTALCHSLPLATLRLYSVYGPFEEPSRLIPALLLAARKGALPALVSKEVKRDFVFAEDVCEAFERTALTPSLEPGLVLNIGSGIQTSIGELVSLVREMYGVEQEPAWGSMPDREWDTTVCWRADRREAERAVGWVPRVSLREGLAATMRWLQEPEHLRVYEGPR